MAKGIKVPGFSKAQWVTIGVVAALTGAYLVWVNRKAILDKVNPASSGNVAYQGLSSLIGSAPGIWLGETTEKFSNYVMDWFSTDAKAPPYPLKEGSAADRGWTQEYGTEKAPPYPLKSGSVADRAWKGTYKTPIQ